MLYIFDSIVWEEIRKMLVEKTTLDERRKVALAIKPEPLVAFCSSCTRGKLENTVNAWGLFNDNKLIFTFLDEETARRASKILKYELKPIRVGWK